MKTEDVIINYNREEPCEYVNVDVRFDNINHYIEGVNKHSLCKMCKKNIRHCCIKRKVMLHKSCSFQFH